MPASLIAPESHVDLDRLNAGSPQTVLGPDKLLESAHAITPALLRRPPETR